MSRETCLARARRCVAQVDDRINRQKLLIARLRVRGINAMRAAQLLDGMNGARQAAVQRLAREEAASRIALWLQAGPSSAIH